MGAYNGLTRLKETITQVFSVPLSTIWNTGIDDIVNMINDRTRDICNSNECLAVVITIWSRARLLQKLSSDVKLHFIGKSESHNCVLPILC